MFNYIYVYEIYEISGIQESICRHIYLQFNSWIPNISYNACIYIYLIISNIWYKSTCPHLLVHDQTTMVSYDMKEKNVKHL